MRFTDDAWPEPRRGEDVVPVRRRPDEYYGVCRHGVQFTYKDAFALRMRLAMCASTLQEKI